MAIFSFRFLKDNSRRNCEFVDIFNALMATSTGFETARRKKGQRAIKIHARNDVIARSEKRPFITINYHLLRDGN